VTESEVAEAVTSHGLRSVKDICRHTGAGDGCTACHAHLRAIVEQLA
jgi:bacterioferritin-associated ferredoxin